jgi:hypothetical protein
MIPGPLASPLEMQPRTTPRAFPIQPPRPGRGLKIASGLGLALATLGFLTLPRYFDRRARTKYKAALHARADDLVRWQGWLETGSCLRHDDGARWLASLDKLPGDATDALQDAVAQDPIADRACLTSLGSLTTDPELPAEAQAVARAWIAADRALERPTTIGRGELRQRIEARDQIRARVRGQLLPAVRAQIHKVKDSHAAARDYIWWHLELGFRLEDVLDRGTLAHRDGKDVAAAIRAPLHTLLDQTREGYSTAGVREMPTLDALARATGDAAWPALQAVEDNGAWNGIEHDNVVFGPMPPEPEGCDPDRE